MRKAQTQNSKTYIKQLPNKNYYEIRYLEPVEFDYIKLKQTQSEIQLQVWLLIY